MVLEKKLLANNYEKNCVLELGQKYVSLKCRNFHLYFEWQRMIAGILKLKNSKEVSCDKSSLDREFFSRIFITISDMCLFSSAQQLKETLVTMFCIISKRRPKVISN